MTIFYAICEMCDSIMEVESTHNGVCACWHGHCCGWGHSPRMAWATQAEAMRANLFAPPTDDNLVEMMTRASVSARDEGLDHISHFLANMSVPRMHLVSMLLYARLFYSARDEIESYDEFLNHCLVEILVRSVLCVSTSPTSFETIDGIEDVTIASRQISNRVSECDFDGLNASMEKLTIDECSLATLVTMLQETFEHRCDLPVWITFRNKVKDAAVQRGFLDGDEFIGLFPT